MARLTYQLWWQNPSIPDFIRSAVSLHRPSALLAPADAVALQRAQIEALHLHPLVSLTDPEAGMRLQGRRGFTDLPISAEWTVRGLAQLAVHNLPRSDARSLLAEMADVSTRPEPIRLAGLLAHLDSLAETLVVVKRASGEFITQHRAHLHALTGSRKLAQECGLPYVSGGKASLNLTRARCFPEFVHEVRFRGLSHVLLLQSGSRWTVPGENAGRQTAMYSAPSSPGVL